MRNLLLQLVVYAALPVIPFRPFFGLLVFSWLAYMRPQDLAWGMGSTRFSHLVALATLLGLAVAVLLGREKLMTFRPQTFLLIALWAWVGLAYLRAVRPDFAVDRFELFGKVILISLITTGMVRTYDRFRALILVIVGSLGLLGLKYAVFGLVRGGVRFDEGPGGFMKDNNTFALAVCMALPLLWGLATVDRSRLVRMAAAGLAAFSVLTIAFTFSRGGLLALAVVASLMFFEFKRPLLGALAIGVAVAGFFLVPTEAFRESYFERASSIRSYEEDSSAMGRIREWETAGRIFRDYPLTGVGPHNLRAVYTQYSDADRYKVSHNSFLQFVVEAGLPAALLLLALLVVTIGRMQRLKSRTEVDWASTYARMLQISLVGFIVGGMFLDMAYFDLLYHLIGLSVCLEVAAAADQASPSQEVENKSELPWWKRPLHSHPPI